MAAEGIQKLVPPTWFLPAKGTAAFYLAHLNYIENITSHYLAAQHVSPLR